MPLEPNPNAAPLLTPKYKEREAMANLFEQQIDELAFKDALYQQDVKYIARIRAMRRCFRKYELKLTEDALRTKNKKTRKRKLARVRQRAEKIVYRQFGPDPARPPPDAAELQQKVAVSEGGYNPELLYVHPSLSPEQREEGLKKICGVNSTSFVCKMLLHLLLHSLKTNKPPIPILINKQYRLIKEAGMIEVPFDLEAWQFADFLEKHLDEATRTRKEVLDALEKGEF